VEYKFDVRQVPAQNVVFARRTCKRGEISAAIGEALAAVGAALQKLGAKQAGPPFTRYTDWRETDCDIESGIPVATALQPQGSDVQSGQLGGGQALHTLHIGHYDKLHDAYEAGAQWLTANNRQPSGPPWEVYVTDPGEVANPDDWKTDIFWPR
jgi:AraC family transcriptional regulator